MPDLVQLTGVGLAGFVSWLMWKLAANHISHNTEILTKLSEAIDHLTEHLKNGK